MEWSLAHPVDDVDEVIELADVVYGHEADGVLVRDRGVFRHRLTVACTEQVFNRAREFISVCRGLGYVDAGGYQRLVDDKLLGFCWFDRGGYTTYSNEEISNAKFHHVDLSLPAKTRVRLINQMIDQHILWANNCGVPVICSTSIRLEHDGFMRIHAKRGFRVHGSYAWGRTQDLLRGLK